MLHLCPIDIEHFDPVVELEVSEAQRAFVLSNALSIAQAYVQPECAPFAALDGDLTVGFGMIALDRDDHEYWIYRVMIDRKYQGRGYGRALVAALMEEIRKRRPNAAIYLGVEPENVRAVKLYRSMGFVPDGRVYGREVVYVCRQSVKE